METALDIFSIIFVVVLIAVVAIGAIVGAGEITYINKKY